jgi:O-methyltransferase
MALKATLLGLLSKLPRRLFWTIMAIYRPPRHWGDDLAVWKRVLPYEADAPFAAAFAQSIAFAPESYKAADLRWRAHTACWAASAALALEGDFVECGVNTVVLAGAICRYVDFNKSGRNFWLFDTYEGIPLTLATARETRKFTVGEPLYKNVWDVATANFSAFPRAHLVKGMVPDTLTSVDIDKVSYLSIDMNLAAPEKAALDYFWPKMVPGAIVVLDDYGFQGHEEQRIMADAFAASKGTKILSLPTGQGLLLKPA